jgi:nicotinamidase-related amidase
MSRALLLVDLQVDFLAADGRLPIGHDQVEPLLAAVNAAVASAMHRADPIVGVGNEFRSADLISNLLRRYAAMRGSSGARWDPRAPKGIDAYFAKAAGNAFGNPQLHAFLTGRGASELVVAGVYASACILKTARGGLSRGYRVQALAPALGDASAVARLRALEKLSAAGVEIVSEY